MQLSDCNIFFQRDKLTEGGEEVYLYYLERKHRWKLVKGSAFRAKSSTAWLYLDSSGKTEKQIHMELIFMFYLEEMIDKNELFKNGMYENYLVHGWKEIVVEHLA